MAGFFLATVLDPELRHCPVANFLVLPSLAFVLLATFCSLAFFLAATEDFAEVFFVFFAVVVFFGLVVDFFGLSVFATFLDFSDSSLAILSAFTWFDFAFRLFAKSSLPAFCLSSAALILLGMPFAHFLIFGPAPLILFSSLSLSCSRTLAAAFLVSSLSFLVVAIFYLYKLIIKSYRHTSVLWNRCNSHG